MTFARGNSLNWGFNEKLTSAQMNTTDAQWPLALDGGAGGTYTPSDKIIIAGSQGFKTTGRFEVTSVALMTGGFLASAATQFGGNMSLTAGFDFSIAFGASITQAGSSVYNSGATITINTGTTTQVNSGATWSFRNTVVLDASSAHLNFSNSATSTFATGTTLTLNSGATLAVNCASTMTAKCTTSSTGRVVKRRVAAVNADHSTYGIDDGDIFDIPTQTANHNYRINTSDAVAGDTMLFTMVSDATNTSANGVALIRDGDSTQIGPSIVKNTNQFMAMEIVFDGTKWQPGQLTNYTP